MEAGVTWGDNSFLTILLMSIGGNTGLGFESLKERCLSNCYFEWDDALNQNEKTTKCYQQKLTQVTKIQHHKQINELC